MTTTPDEVAAGILETIPPSMRAIRAQMRSGRAAGMSVAQFRLLVFVRRNPGTSLSTLADHLATSRPAASQLVERLVQAGLVTREQHAEERRRVELRLTDAGAAALAECDARTRAWLRERLAGLGEVELERIAATLRELHDLLADVPACPPCGAARA
ncbi:MAG: MarR family transcriptional regulator [Candidatus Limnocylindrales bacterium]|jgi:DNA-binding MarR family transcriptional regulator